jgi:hypothetical protein
MGDQVEDTDIGEPAGRYARRDGAKCGEPIVVDWDWIWHWMHHNKMACQCADPKESSGDSFVGLEHEQAESGVAGVGTPWMYHDYYEVTKHDEGLWKKSAGIFSSVRHTHILNHYCHEP